MAATESDTDPAMEAAGESEGTCRDDDCGNGSASGRTRGLTGVCAVARMRVDAWQHMHRAGSFRCVEGQQFSKLRAEVSTRRLTGEHAPEPGILPALLIVGIRLGTHRGSGVTCAARVVSCWRSAKEPGCKT